MAPASEVVPISGYRGDVAPTGCRSRAPRPLWQHHRQPNPALPVAGLHHGRGGPACGRRVSGRPRRSHGAADGWQGSIRPVVDLRTRREPAPVDCPQADRRAAPAGEHGRDPCRCQDGGQARRRPGHHQVAQRRKDRRPQGGGHTHRGGLPGRTARKRRSRHRAQRQRRHSRTPGDRGHGDQSRGGDGSASWNAPVSW